jgi:competence protein ComEA
MSGDRRLTLGLALDLNTATSQDLEALPGIGPVMAQRLVQFRQAHGPFKELKDLLAVSGIGEQKLTKIKPYLTVLSAEGAGR